MSGTILRKLKTFPTCALLTMATFLFSSSLTAQTFDYSIVYSFSSIATGEFPRSRLLLDNGNLYGTASYGGVFRSGVVFEIGATGVETTYSFGGGAEGSTPQAGLISDPAGNLYGVTYGGGDLSCQPPHGCGTVFKLDSSHNFAVLHAFTADEGYQATSPLVRDQLGNLYGSLGNGGSSGFGAVFKLDTLGNLTLLRKFSGIDGSHPNGLIVDSFGNLYGTTAGGGAFAHGEVFKLDPTGRISILYSFAGGSDGDMPVGGLTRDSAGNVYGATIIGGGSSSCASGCGILFKVNLQSRTETVPHVFTGGENGDGANPNGDLVIDSSGNLFGTTQYGGNAGGAIFMLDANGGETILHSFYGPADGDRPAAGLTMDRSGNLYGTTEAGPAGGVYGSVYKLTRH